MYVASRAHRHVVAGTVPAPGKSHLLLQPVRLHRVDRLERMPLAADLDAGALKVIDMVVAALLDMWVPPRPFDDRAELAERVDRAVEDAGIRWAPC